MTLTEYSLLTFTSLFAIVDPIAIVPSFLAMTHSDRPEQQLRMAKIASTVAAGALVTFALAGRWIFKFLGITLPAFQIAGSILLLRIALDMLYAKRSGAKESQEEIDAGAAKDDIAVTPLGVPMLAGPGAFSTSLILLSQARGVEQHLALFVSIALVSLLTYLILRLAVRGARMLNPLALKLAARLMGLLLAAVAVQFALNGLAQTALFSRTP